MVVMVTSCEWNGKSTAVLHFAFQIFHPGLQNVALIWIPISTWCTYFILHFQMVSTRCKQNGKSTVVLHFAFQTHPPGLQNVAPIWIHISRWCTFFILHFQMVTPTCSFWSHDNFPPKILKIGKCHTLTFAIIVCIFLSFQLYSVHLSHYLTNLMTMMY